MKFIRTLLSRNGKPLNFSNLEKKITPLCQKYKIDLFYIFGSYATNNATKLSDIDLAYYSHNKINILNLLAELEKIFQEEAIDIVNLQKAPPHLIHRILRHGKCLFTSNLKLKIAFETEKENEYFDSAWMRQDYFKAMEERIEHGTYGT